MSQLRWPCEDGREVVFGYDEPFHTFFLQLWDPDFDPDFDMGAPAKVAGYHPNEHIPPYAGEYAQYPLLFEEIGPLLESWGVGLEDREQVGAMLTADRLAR